MKDAELAKYFTPLAMKCMRENSINLKKLGTRLAFLDELDDVFSFKTRGRKSIYPKWAYETAKKNGISRQLLYERVKKRGMTIEDAVGPKRQRSS
ncbi:hypothetical protein D3C75_670910 [compost metagenome]